MWEIQADESQRVFFRAYQEGGGMNCEIRYQVTKHPDLVRNCSS